jgi:hypothetical protein
MATVQGWLVFTDTDKTQPAQQWDGNEAPVPGVNIPDGWTVVPWTILPGPDGSPCLVSQHYELLVGGLRHTDRHDS